MSLSAAVPQSAAHRNAEPSMEEILASIRKIIAEDQKALEAKHGAPVVNAPIEAAPAVNDDSEDAHFDPVLPEPVIAHTPAPEPVVAEPAPVPAAAVQTQPVQSQPSPAFEPRTEPSRLISEETAQSAGAAFQSLANTVFTQQARTMDDLVSEMLRPMLQAWLDDNLPALVERLVKTEIERVARGGR